MPGTGSIRIPVLYIALGDWKCTARRRSGGDGSCCLRALSPELSAREPALHKAGTGTGVACFSVLVAVACFAQLSPYVQSPYWQRLTMETVPELAKQVEFGGYDVLKAWAWE